MDSITLLRALPATSEIEAGLRRAGSLLANSETAKMLDRYRAARVSLARSVAAASARAFGVAMAAAEDEMTPEQAARVAQECAAYLEPLVAK
jgi:hypothetical protein